MTAAETATHLCVIDDHSWQSSISIGQIEARIRDLADGRASSELRAIASDLAADVGRWLAARSDRRICGWCGIQGRLIGTRVIPAIPDPGAPTETS